MTTAVQDRSTTDLPQIKKWLGVNTDRHDEILEEVLQAAKEHADDHLNNPFRKNGVNQAIPKRVELWIKKFCARAYNHPTLGIKQTQVVNSGTELISAVWHELYQDLMGRRRVPGFSTR